MRFRSSDGMARFQRTFGTTPNMAPPSRRKRPPATKWTLYGPMVSDGTVACMDDVPEYLISRVLSDRSVATISLGRASPRASSDLPGTQARRATSRPLFGLSPGGVYLAGGVAASAGALLPHRFTLTSGLRPRRSAL